MIFCFFFCKATKLKYGGIPNTFNKTLWLIKNSLLLAKRGPKAFTLFINALRDPDISCADLADDLKQEERKLRGGAGTFFILWKITVSNCQ